MDREIPKEVRQKERRRRFIKIGLIGGTAIVLLAALFSVMRTSVKLSDLRIATIDTGTIETSVTSSGKVVPAFEEIINSPINTRIVEVYRKAGDLVEEGTPLLRLDLLTAQNDYDKLLDEAQMKRHQLEQLRLNNITYLKNLEMQVKVKEMAVNRLAVELRNEQYLDSLGSGTGDNVRQAKFAYDTGCLELEQLRQQYANETEVKKADMKVKELELSIFSKNMEEMRRTLDDAQIRSPRKAVLTFIDNQIGAQVAQGSQVAIISDLSHFKVDCEIADSYGDRVRVGAHAVVKVGTDTLSGMISNVTPMSRNGVIAFSVQLNDDANPRLRSGLKTDVYVMSNVMDDVMRIPNASYYTGPGSYELWVQTSDNELTRRNVRLGQSNYQYVEVIDGLKPGDRVVTSDMSQFKTNKSLKLK